MHRKIARKGARRGIAYHSFYFPLPTRHILHGLSNPLKNKTIVSSFHKHSFSCAVPEGLPSDLQEDPDSSFPGLRPHLHSPLRSAGRARRGSFIFPILSYQGRAKSKFRAWHCFLCSQTMLQEPHANTLYKHFYFFVTEHNMVSSKELEALVNEFERNKDQLIGFAEGNDGAPAGKRSESSSPPHVSHPISSQCVPDSLFATSPLFLFHPAHFNFQNKSTLGILLLQQLSIFIFVFHSSSSLSFLVKS